VEKQIRAVAAGCIGVITVGFVGGVFALVYYMTRPTGDAVGRVELSNANPELVVTANAADAFHFRTDVSAGVPALSFDSDQEERNVLRSLRSSTLTIKAVSPGGIERSVSCPVYKGRSSTVMHTQSTYSISGMLNDCVIPVDTTGAWKVRPSVSWASDLSLKKATLEVRRETPQK
jgi:hypothetical protein